MAANETLARPDAVAFDLDGTVVDTAPDIAAALNHALHAAGLPRVGLQQVRGWIGDGPDPLIARALAVLDTTHDARLPALLRAHFDRATLAEPLKHGRVFDGVESVLRQLRARWPLVVVTNKPGALARAVLDAAGLSGHFAGVHGADTAALRKPAPALLWRAAQALGIVPARLWMVGDAATDMAAAAAAGATAVWAGWGYGRVEALPVTPRWRIDHPLQLHSLLDAAR